jgi:hypothetical protein
MSRQLQHNCGGQTRTLQILPKVPGTSVDEKIPGRHQAIQVAREDPSDAGDPICEIPRYHNVYLWLLNGQSTAGTCASCM